MTFAPRLFIAILLMGTLWAHGEEPAVFRVWIAGQEAGGSTRKTTLGPEGEREESREWSHLERMGTLIEQEVKETSLKRPDGSMHFTWELSLSQEPFTGEATWSPREPGRLEVTFKNGSPRTVDLPRNVTLWPGDLDAMLREAARKLKPVKVKSYSLPTQQWNTLALKPLGPDPLPGFPDTVHFKGQVSEGELALDVEYWISPVHGEIKQVGAMAGISQVSQRAELPPPDLGAAGQGLFERSVKNLPPHPFLLWVPGLKVRWNGRTEQILPEDPQQRRLGKNRYTLLRAAPPSGKAAAERPVKGSPSPQDAPFLAATPLAQFNDPVFDGLVRRLNAPPGATRWELAQRITSFVYDWIRDKNYTVGFASAQEVARTPKGDCTEHGVLAVALLRRLGVPARGVTGWMAFGDSMGLHFWVEARIGGRWVPLDPTFNQAPASAFRLKLGTSDLADLGSVGWESAAMSFTAGSWIPEAPWAAEVRIQGDTIMAPGGARIRVPGGRWSQIHGRLELLWEGRHGVEAVPPPAPALVASALRLQGGEERGGWWDPALRQLWMDAGGGKWLRVDALAEDQAFRLLEGLETQHPRVLKEAA